METLEELKAIVKNAPSGATAIGVCNDTDSISYLKSDSELVNNWYHWVCGEMFCVDYDFTVVFDEIRSLSDIKRIIELMEWKENIINRCKSLIHADDMNTGYEPSLSVFQREIDLLIGALDS